MSSDIFLLLIDSLIDDCFVETELLEFVDEYEELDEELILESDNDGLLDGLSSENWISLSERLLAKEIVPTSDISLAMAPFSFVS